MDPTPYDEETLSEVLQIYAAHPMTEGDAALLLDHKRCVEVEQLTVEWDAQLCENTAYILRASTKSVIVAIARPGATLLPQDFQLWRDLHRELRGSDVDLRPLRALPAA